MVDSVVDEHFPAPSAPSRYGRAVKRVAVVQSNYLPWKGYFDLIHDVDLFVFYDDVQYTKGDWRSRNRIKTPRGVEWLSVPVGTSLHRRICDVRIADLRWASRHWRLLEQHYSAAPFFDTYSSFLENLLCGSHWGNLSALNQTLVTRIARDLLGISTEFRDSREFAPVGHRLDRLLDLLQKTDAEVYLSGPAARAYVDPARFAAAGIELRWKDYSGYPEYSQRYPPFAHGVTILDLLFNVGPAAPYYIWGWRADLRRKTALG